MQARHLVLAVFLVGFQRPGHVWPIVGTGIAAVLFTLGVCYRISAVLMFQKEFADRATARPGSAHWGRLGVGVHVRCDAEIVKRVKAGHFVPPPKVGSAVVRI